MATGSGSGSDDNKDQGIPKIEATTDVVELVAHLDDPEGDPIQTLAAMQKRLAPWTLGRKGGEGTAIMKVKRISPAEMRMDCGELPVDVHTPFDWSQIPLNYGSDGVYYIRLYWGPKRIGQLGVIEFPEWRMHGVVQPPIPTIAQPQTTIPIQATGNQQQLLLQLVQAMTNQQHASNQAVSDALEANTKAILAFAEARQNQTEQKPAGLFDELDKFADVAGKLKKFQKLIGGLGGEPSPDESAWVGLAREVIDEYGEDTIAGTFQLINSFRKDRSEDGNKTVSEVEGTVIELPKNSEGTGE